MRNHSVASCVAPPALFQERPDATRNVVTGVPCGVKRSSGSAPSRPVIMTLFKSLLIAVYLSVSAVWPQGVEAAVGSAGDQRSLRRVSCSETDHLLVQQTGYLQLRPDPA